MRFYLTLASLLIANTSIAQECSKLAIKQGNETKIVYTIEHAITPEQRSKGLMYRKSMPEQNGMLFTWEVADRRAMWMKNTYIPLDMIFINNNKIVGIVENTVPHSLQARYVEPLVDQALEINAGQAQKNSIAINDVIECVNF